MNELWNIENDHIVREVKKGETFYDDVEMSGLYVDLIAGYGVNADGTLHLSRHCYFPTLRTIPNNTHGTYFVPFEGEKIPRLLVNGEVICEFPEKFTLDGTLKINCKTRCGLFTERTIFPSSDALSIYEIITVTAQNDVKISLNTPHVSVFSYGRGTKGVYVAMLTTDLTDTVEIKAGNKLTFGIRYSCNLSGKDHGSFDYPSALMQRKERIKELADDSLVLKTGIPELDIMTRFAKIRAGESIFRTLSGDFHSPGGRAYYAAIWCNDQIEYSGPHFAMTGDRVAINAAINAYRAYIPFMSDCYHRLPSSIIAEGLDIWEGAGDRGDAAMYLYGASLFCLLTGDLRTSNELYPAIKWCAEYCERKKLPEGVISSDSDELEGRFPTDGRANLSTSSLSYGGLILAAMLAKALDKEDDAEIYTSRAKKLALAIENYFGEELHGYHTYRYSKGFNTLRAWICLPLCMGIEDRKDGTVNAMLSPYLWQEDGMLTCEKGEENKSDTIWDRSTLYGLRCGFLCGFGDVFMEKLIKYCKNRLLGDRVPYPVEAYPEGSRRHLSGESALFVRIVTEGLFAIRPESLDSFSFIPRLPKGVDRLTLEKIKISGGCFDIHIANGKWTVKNNGKAIKEGQTTNNRITVYNE